ncbi:alcohol dehydrogenase catalytic domain-containing protein [Saccharopolyspora sp. NFXS83]|uniref:alcohol dehydrogenase catalytic domain-containing protein n=1 Tax=Saccharopolyspora sp. NFXS83 TaxID=2993560 RepID=UPI00224AC7C4|nr:alcohol dehydrogenase catalytic domain-containing protein [Saccharopolyspora sp. NFXS83]MCX2731543.1 alcohol dehydrogenase catalytic domain-containing protein [Saccharopolyspora sp. NFXS83]
MHVVTFDEPGGPEVLRVTEVDTADPGPDEVRIRIEYLGVNRPDALFRAELYPDRPTFPRSRLGIEAVGVVEALGGEVTGLAPGDRVVAGPIAQQSRHGVYGDVAVVPAAEVVPAFDVVSAETTAAVWMAYFTAFGGLVETGGLLAWSPPPPAASGWPRSMSPTTRVRCRSRPPGRSASATGCSPLERHTSW